MYLTISPRLIKLSLITLLALFLSFPSHAQKVVATYYAADGNTATIDNLPAKQLTHVLYAFLAVCGDNRGASVVTQQAIEKACDGKAPFTAVMFNEEQAKKRVKSL
jgi:GH18 family chitinase